MIGVLNSKTLRYKDNKNNNREANCIIIPKKKIGHRVNPI